MANIIEITDFNSPQLDIYARMSEGQLLNRHEPEKGIFIAESPKVVERALDAGCEPISMLVERKHIDGEAKSVIILHVLLGFLQSGAGLSEFHGQRNEPVSDGTFVEKPGDGFHRLKRASFFSAFFRTGGRRRRV